MNIKHSIIWIIILYDIREGMATSNNGSGNSTIKHIVISSGGPAGHMMYSILRTLNLKGLWEFDNIKSIYGSSIGSFISILLALRYDWSVIDDYIIKRPFEKIFMLGGSNTTSTTSGEQSSTENSKFADAKNKLDFAYRLYTNKGLYGIKEFTEILRPPLQGKDIALNVTFQEFYEKTGVELHFMVTELNSFTIVDFSYKTHPNQQIIEACYMSCCYPFGLTPIYRDGCCYMDGGIINEYPLNECILDQKCNISEILGIKMMWERKPANLTENSSMFQFFTTFLNQIHANFFENRIKTAIPNEVVCVSKVFGSRDWVNWIRDEKYRRELMLRGETFANVFMLYRRNYQETMKTHQHSVVREIQVLAETIQKLPVSITEPEAKPEPEPEAKPEPERPVDLQREPSDECATTVEPPTFQLHNTEITMV